MDSSRARSGAGANGSRSWCSGWGKGVDAEPPRKHFLRPVRGLDFPASTRLISGAAPEQPHADRTAFLRNRYAVLDAQIADRRDYRTIDFPDRPGSGDGADVCTERRADATLCRYHRDRNRSAASRNPGTDSRLRPEKFYRQNEWTAAPGPGGRPPRLRW